MLAKKFGGINFCIWSKRNSCNQWKFSNILEHAYFKNKEIDKKNIYSEFPKDVYGFGHQRFYTEIITITNKLNNTFSLKSSIQCIELIHAMYRSSKLNKTINLSSKKNKSFDKMEA